MANDIIRYAHHARDPAAWATDELHWSPDKVQAGVLRWWGNELLINCTRQWGKTDSIAIKAGHRALFYSDSNILITSASKDQALELFERIKKAYGKLNHPPTLLSDSKLRIDLENGSRISSGYSTEKGVRSKSALSLLIEDEAAITPDELYYATRPMLAISHGAKILMTTPRGKRGHFHDAWKREEDHKPYPSKPGKFGIKGNVNGMYAINLSQSIMERGRYVDRVRIPALQCPRYDRDFLLDEYVKHPKLWFLQEYMCEFIADYGQLFTSDMIDGSIVAGIKDLFDIAGDPGIKDLFDGV